MKFTQSKVLKGSLFVTKQLHSLVFESIFLLLSVQKQVMLLAMSKFKMSKIIYNKCSLFRQHLRNEFERFICILNLLENFFTNSRYLRKKKLPNKRHKNYLT